MQKIQRNSNLELYRIIVMLLIVAHHYVVNSGLVDELIKLPMSGKSLFFYIFGMWGKTGINCFVLITGYFMCKSQITLRKFLKLLLQVEFYNIAVNAVFALTGCHHYSLKDVLLLLLPVKSIADGFVSCFLVFYLFIPFLNILVSHLDKRRHGQLVALCLFAYTLMGTFNCFRVTMNYVSWFCVLYLIASYIRLYGLLPKASTAQWGGVLGDICNPVGIERCPFGLYCGADGRDTFQRLPLCGRFQCTACRDDVGHLVHVFQGLENAAPQVDKHSGGNHIRGAFDTCQQ